MSATSKCPSCFKDIKAKSKFCKFCGIPLKICPMCEDHNKVEDMFCGSCGENIKEVKVEAPINVKRSPQGQPAPIQDPIAQGITGGKPPQLVIWPPIDQSSMYAPPVTQTRQVIPDGPSYEPPVAKYDYDRVRPFGFFSGPIPLSNIVSPAVESFGYALAFIAIGVVIASIGLAFFEFLIPPIITGILGGALILSAPFFGIYYVSSKWLYKIFQIKRPVKMSTIMLNYGFGTLIFSILGLAFSPLLILDSVADVNPTIGITIFTVIAALIYFLGLFIIPLKAFLADLVYVKSAMNQREKEEEKEKEEMKK
ncbi:MAG: zinc ribbon domain-containing protein [Candidatus Heimdallarchaeota archaeon]|nr:zinc ribbon domain-containing protein [Candidatus Heimdallarchaeota archaeon]